jgi:hypothetical protein
MKKIIIVGVIFLFVGLGFQSAFANDNNISIGKVEQQPRDETFFRTFGGDEIESGKYVQQTTDGGYIIVGDIGEIYVWLIKTDSAGNLEWDKTYSKPLSNRHIGYCVQQTTDGGYIILAHRYHTLSQAGGAWLIKTDSNGSIIWEKTHGGYEWYYGKCVKQTIDGGYIIAGTTIKNYDNMWLIKTDSNGNITWDQNYGGPSYEEGNYVEQTTDGGYIVVGETFSYGAGSYDIYLVKTDSAGNMIWDKTFGGTNGDFGYCVQQTNDGGYILTGVTKSFGSGYEDVYLVKTDNNGNKVWDKTFRGILDNWGNSVRETTDGGYIITGKYMTLYGAGDVCLIKTDSAGILEWEKTFNGGIGFEEGYCVQQTTDDGYIITGEIKRDVCLIKTDKDGNVKSKPVNVEDCDCKTVVNNVDINGLKKLNGINDVFNKILTLQKMDFENESICFFISFRLLMIIGWAFMCYDAMNYYYEAGNFLVYKFYAFLFDRASERFYRFVDLGVYFECWPDPWDSLGLKLIFKSKTEFKNNIFFLL